MIQEVRINLIPTGIPPVAYYSQIDNKRKVRFYPYEGDQVYTIPAGANVIVSGKKPDGMLFAYDLESTLVDGTPIVQIEQSGTILVVSTPQMVACAGDVECKLNIMMDGESLGSLLYTSRVSAHPLADDQAASQADLPAVQSMLDEQIEVAEELLEETNTAMTEAVERVAALEEAAQQDASDAQNSAENAQESATNADNSAQAAGTSADNAAGSATLAESYAKGGTGTRPGEDADNALEYKTQAQNAATAAQGAATNAGASAETAQAAALSASNDKTIATDKATEAAGSATQAAGSASTAIQKAGEANTSAGNAADSATLARSFAKGDTHTREGEETDSADYYRQMAQTHAATANQKAQAAATSATNAAGSATAAAGSATAAAGSATDAAGSADDAEDAAEAAAQSAEEAKQAAEEAQAIAHIDTMTNSTMGIGRPDTLTAKANNGIFTAVGVAIKALINPQATGDYTSDWLTDMNGNVLTPDAAQMYRVVEDTTLGTCKLYYWNGTEYAVLTGGGGTSDTPVGDVSGASAVASGSSVTIKWSDPTDVTVSGIVIAAWGGTVVVRKAGSAPVSRRDGTVVVNNKNRNRYATEGFVDTGLTYGTTYYYRFFPYTTGQLYTDGSSVNATPERTEIAVTPTVSGALTYTGSAQNAPVIGADLTKMAASGDTSATAAGDYTITYTPLDGYCWAGGSTAALTLQWSIDKASVTIPTISGSFTYDGTVKTVTVTGMDSTKVTASGTSATNAGTHHAVFSLIDSLNNEWSDGATVDKTLDWTISKATVSIPTTYDGFTFDGSDHSAIGQYDSNLITVTGTSHASAAGSYSFIMALTDSSNYIWSDGTSADITHSWRIVADLLTVPTVTSNLTYNGTAQSPTIGTYDTTKISATGTSGTDAGTYHVVFHIIDPTSYLWSDNTSADKSVEWTIGKASVGIPSLSGSYTYTGSEQTVTVTGMDSTKVSATGLTGTNAGSYTAVFSLIDDDNYEWTGGTVADVSLSWSIAKASVAVPTLSGTLTYNGSSQSITVSAYDSSVIEVTGTSGTNAGSYTATFHLLDNNHQWSDGTTADKTASWSIAKAAGSVTLSSNTVSLDSDHLTRTVTATGTGTLSLNKTTGTYATAALSSGTITFTATQESGEETFTVNAAASTNYNAASATITVEATFSQIYGAEWDGTSSTAWSRTDAAAGFTNPSPAVNNGSGSSPFDNIAPWSGLKKVTDATGGTLVEIPKYYYKWTYNGVKMKLQISERTFDGALVSPAHADRGDGKGVRDKVYVGRYHCDSSYKSTTGAKPLANKTRSEFRTGIHNLGAAYWQYDFAMYWTIMMLYLVEFADWNSQDKIGYGCGNNSATENQGSTDGMQYHTGTNAANRTTYGHVQYRYIEGLWDNVYDWCDGIYFSGADVYAIKNPANFSDTTGGTKVGTRPTSSNYISAFNHPSASGFEYALYPSAVAGSDSTYVCDYCSYNSSGVVLRVGGYYNQSKYYGAFYMHGDNTATNKYAVVGSRLQKLP